jgi:hypothetical protein
MSRKLSDSIDIAELDRDLDEALGIGAGADTSLLVPTASSSPPRPVPTASSSSSSSSRPAAAASSSPGSSPSDTKLIVLDDDDDVDITAIMGGAEFHVRAPSDSDIERDLADSSDSDSADSDSEPEPPKKKVKQPVSPASSASSAAPAPKKKPATKKAPVKKAPPPPPAKKVPEKKVPEKAAGPAPPKPPRKRKPAPKKVKTVDHAAPDADSRPDSAHHYMTKAIADVLNHDFNLGALVMSNFGCKLTTSEPDPDGLSKQRQVTHPKPPTGVITPFRMLERHGRGERRLAVSVVYDCGVKCSSSCFPASVRLTAVFDAQEACTGCGAGMLRVPPSALELVGLFGTGAPALPAWAQSLPAPPRGFLADPSPSLLFSDAAHKRVVFLQRIGGNVNLHAEALVTFACSKCPRAVMRVIHLVFPETTEERDQLSLKTLFDAERARIDCAHGGCEHVVATETSTAVTLRRTAGAGLEQKHAQLAEVSQSLEAARKMDKAMRKYRWCYHRLDGKFLSEAGVSVVLRKPNKAQMDELGALERLLTLLCDKERRLQETIKHSTFSPEEVAEAKEKLQHAERRVAAVRLRVEGRKSEARARHGLV